MKKLQILCAVICALSLIAGLLLISFDRGRAGVGRAALPIILAFPCVFFYRKKE